MIKKVTKIINEFDPLNLLPYAPLDEYEREINEIVLFLENDINYDLDILANKIYNIFKRTIGEEIFNKSINDCYYVASKILE